MMRHDVYPEGLDPRNTQHGSQYGSGGGAENPDRHEAAGQQDAS